MLEHNDVYTAGTSAQGEELLSPQPIPVIHTGRGGKYTYHGPGQRVIYPILDLSLPTRKKDIRQYVSNLEEWVINTLAQVGVKAYCVPGRVGIWVDDGGGEAKIGAIGVRVKKWVTHHGIAVNIFTDVNKFSGIIPCGLANFPVTSLARLGIKIDVLMFDQILKSEYTKIFK